MSLFAHNADGEMKTDAFKLAVQKVVTAFSSLKLDTKAMKKISKGKTFHYRRSYFFT